MCFLPYKVITETQYFLLFSTPHPPSKFCWTYFPNLFQIFPPYGLERNLSLVKKKIIAPWICWDCLNSKLRTRLCHPSWEAGGETPTAVLTDRAKGLYLSFTHLPHKEFDDHTQELKFCTVSVCGIWKKRTLEDYFYWG